MDIIKSLTGRTANGSKWELTFSGNYLGIYHYSLVIDGMGDEARAITVRGRESACNRAALLDEVAEELASLEDSEQSGAFKDALEYFPEILQLPGKLQAELADLCESGWTIEAVEDTQIELCMKHSTDVEDVLVYRRNLKSWLIESISGQFTGSTATEAIARDAEHTAEMLDPMVWRAW